MSYRILLVDPDETAAAAAKLALAANGYRAAAVGTFAEATRQAWLDRPDLIVTALRLRAYNGLHLLLRCRADHPELPVIIMGRPEDFCSDIAYHGAQFFSEPRDLASLVTLVSRLLVGRFPRDSQGERVGSGKRAGQALFGGEWGNRRFSGSSNRIDELAPRAGGRRVLGRNLRS